jgi:hypothetical protein
MIGRYCDINGEQEVSNLEYGLDFRQPKYRREVFLRFYEFHLKYKAHAGAIYYTFPYLHKELKMTTEQRLWFAFINGCSQNVISTYLIFEQFPSLESFNLQDFNRWFRTNYEKIGWDTDRRYVKNSLDKCILSYIENLNGRSQEQFYNDILTTTDKYKNFELLWEYVINNFYTFGRLATFSFIEFLKVSGLNVDCNSLFLDDISGSKSHRNGLCKVLGRDDMDWWKNDVTYSKDYISWLSKEGELLLNDARARYDHPDLSYFTLETTLCCYKSWHRPNRRYPNVYNDMFYERIKYASKKWNNKNKFDIFWDCRKESLPKHLLLEYTPKDYGLNPVKQNHYLNTGQVIMMDKEWECFSNNYNEYTKR